MRKCFQRKPEVVPNPRSARPSAASRSEKPRSKTGLHLTQATANARAATAALHDAIDPKDKHSQGMAAVLAFMADTVASVIEARCLNTAPTRKPRLRPS